MYRPKLDFRLDENKTILSVYLHYMDKTTKHFGKTVIFSDVIAISQHQGRFSKLNWLLEWLDPQLLLILLVSCGFVGFVLVLIVQFILRRRLKRKYSK